MSKLSYEELEKKIKELEERFSMLKSELFRSRDRLGYEPNIRDVPTIQKEIDSVTKEYDNARQTLLTTPKIIESYTITGSLISKWDYEFNAHGIRFTIHYNRTFKNWSSPDDMYSAGLHTVIETDEKGTPTKILRYFRNSDTRGMLHLYQYDVKLDIAINENLEIISKEPKTDVETVINPDVLVKDFPSRAMPSAQTMEERMQLWKCPRCGIELQRVYFELNKCCRNCALPLSEWATYKQGKQLESERTRRHIPDSAPTDAKIGTSEELHKDKRT